ncbi:hypothetical protein DV711_15050 [Motiliproteus coralliicola]|uniref:Uncharacterized protein n=1 Tax=Motiliproteus coralliicola TaxID=2283196 RepID=A0A369WE79_9GAMM|nr:hypothetical protein DV711_15050 [Motiliproteus coralliicola]
MGYDGNSLASLTQTAVFADPSDSSMLTGAKGDQGVCSEINGVIVSACTDSTALDAADHWLREWISTDYCLRPQAEFNRFPFPKTTRRTNWQDSQFAQPEAARRVRHRDVPNEIGEADKSSG